MLSRICSAFALSLLLLCGAALAAPVEVSLELSQQFFYEGDPLNLRVSVRNGSAEAIDNPVKIKLFEGLKVTHLNGEELEAKKGGKVDSPSRPSSLAAQAFYGGVVDVSTIYPELRKPGRYKVYWSGNGLLSSQFALTVIPQFDPNLDYRAQVQTSEGSFEIYFFQKESPIASKAFIDMANSGFYDGLQIQEVRPDQYVAGGNPAVAGRQAQAFQYPAEISSLPIVSGTVVMKPAGAAPPSNGPEFMILLRPQPKWQGQVTVVGQVAKGLDVVQKLSRFPSSGAEGRPAFRPTREIVIKTIDVQAQKPAENQGN